MFKRILVPLDGSTRAEQSIRVAARIARSQGGSVILLRVATAPIDTGKFSSSIGYVEEVVNADLNETKTYLEHIAGSSELAGLHTEVNSLTGAVAPTSLSAAESLHADLVVMCSHGYTGFKRWALGSVADKITQHASVPVLVLREGGREIAPADQRPVRALVAVDGSSLSETALEPAAFLASALAEATSQQGALHLIRVVDLPASGGKFKSDAHIDTGTKEQGKHEDEEYLDTLTHRIEAGDLSHLNLAITSSIEVDPDIAEAIVKKAEQDAFDFIAIATHGRGGVQKWALGSVAGRVLHASKLPLLIMRPQDIHASAGS